MVLRNLKHDSVQNNLYEKILTLAKTVKQGNMSEYSYVVKQLSLETSSYCSYKLRCRDDIIKAKKKEKENVSVGDRITQLSQVFQIKRQRYSLARVREDMSDVEAATQKQHYEAITKPPTEPKR